MNSQKNWHGLEHLTFEQFRILAAPLPLDELADLRQECARRMNSVEIPRPVDLASIGTLFLLYMALAGSALCYAGIHSTGLAALCDWVVAGGFGLMELTLLHVLEVIPGVRRRVKFWREYAFWRTRHAHALLREDEIEKKARVDALLGRNTP